MRSSFWLLAVATTFVCAQDFSSDDYPASCDLHCGPIVSYAGTCDGQFDNDADQLDCLCTGPNMASSILFCEECVHNYTTTTPTDDYNEIDELRAACGFPAPLPEGGSSATTATTSATPSTSVLNSSTVVTNSTVVTSSSMLPSSSATSTTTTPSGVCLTSPSPSACLSSTTSTTSSEDDTTPTAASTSASAPSQVESGNLAIATAAPVLGAGAAAILAAFAAM